MTKRRTRHLSKEDRQLWDQVAKSTIPLARSKSVLTMGDDPPAPKAAPTLPKTKQTFDKKLPLTPAGRVPPITDIPAETRSALNMDKRTFQKMKRGKTKPQARIDLHGMTVARAHPALTAFVMRASSEGKRLVLVITGKGRTSEDHGPIPMRQGVLRHQVPHWLSIPPLAHLVLQVTEAHQSHGGGGAYYVYLRKIR
jgi:DNA-nicking Smr family endonuclease